MDSATTDVARIVVMRVAQAREKRGSRSHADSALDHSVTCAMIFMRQKCILSVWGWGVSADVAAGRLGGSDDNFGPNPAQILCGIH